MVQWLILHALNVRGLGSVVSEGTGSHTLQLTLVQPKKERDVFFNLTWGYSYPLCRHGREPHRHGRAMTQCGIPTRLSNPHSLRAYPLKAQHWLLGCQQANPIKMIKMTTRPESASFFFLTRIAEHFGVK